MRCTSLLVAVAPLAPAVLGGVPADLVTDLPGFSPMPTFKVYSGYLNVTGPVGPEGYSLSIHYQLDMSQNNPDSDPLTVWHQGGPGGSSLYGQYGEMGYFQVDGNGTHANSHAWNKVTNMLYLESPAGSNDPIGFSTCSVNGKLQDTCSWNDVTQAEAYAHTLAAFYAAFPELAKNKLFLAGESYAGQYIPNIANYLLSNAATFPFPLEGILVGNGCWGGSEHSVVCNGINSEQNDADMFYGKGLVSKALYNQINQECDWPKTNATCDALLEKMSAEVGPHNVYDIYDNCPPTAEWLRRSGKSMRWLKNYLRGQMDSNTPKRTYQPELLALGGGYDWSCDGLPAMAAYFGRADVQAALHLGKPFQGHFRYQTSGPASVTLYPDLVKKIRVLIYNGDADSCVPYKGNEEWTTDLAATGAVTQVKPWHPWYEKGVEYMPAGYATTYKSAANPDLDFSFITIRLAGHMVPAFQPGPAQSFFEKFISGEGF